MRERQYFTRVEAEAKLGRKVQTLVEFSGVPKDTTGEVVRADPAGKTEPPFGEARETFDVGVQWDLPRSQPKAELVYDASIGYQPYIFAQSGKPLIDWFSKDEYEEFLQELENG